MDGIQLSVEELKQAMASERTRDSHEWHCRGRDWCRTPTWASRQGYRFASYVKVLLGVDHIDIMVLAFLGR
jgi:hypothetical protein